MHLCYVGYGTNHIDISAKHVTSLSYLDEEMIHPRIFYGKKISGQFPVVCVVTTNIFDKESGHLQQYLELKQLIQTLTICFCGLTYPERNQSTVTM